MKSEAVAPIFEIDRKSIVVIGDDPLTIRIVRALFRGAQYEIDCISSCELGGVELAIASVAAAELPKQLALVSMGRHQLDTTIARQLRLRGFNGPIVGFTNDDDHSRYVEAGFNDFLRTPVHPHTLIALVERYL